MTQQSHKHVGVRGYEDALARAIEELESQTTLNGLAQLLRDAPTPYVVSCVLSYVEGRGEFQSQSRAYYGPVREALAMLAAAMQSPSA